MITGWSRWSGWGPCSKTCVKSKSRRCLSPGRCPGVAIKTRSCNMIQGRCKHQVKKVQGMGYFFMLVTFPLQTPYWSHFYTARVPLGFPGIVPGLK